MDIPKLVPHHHGTLKCALDFALNFRDIQPTVVWASIRVDYIVIYIGSITARPITILSCLDTIIYYFEISYSMAVDALDDALKLRMIGTRVL